MLATIKAHLQAANLNVVLIVTRKLMKRLKSKRYKLHKDLIRTAVANIEHRIETKRQWAADVADAERIADERFIQKNRLQIEIYIGGIQCES